MTYFRLDGWLWMFTKEELFESILEGREEIRKFGVKRIGPFGSFVRGEQEKKSDWMFLLSLRRRDF